MNQEEKYFTLQQMDEFLSAYNERGGPLLNFREALGKMQEEHLLSSDGTINVMPDVEMDRDTFDKVYRNIPWDGSLVLNIPEEEYWERVARENTVFFPGQSVFCRKLSDKMYRHPVELEYFDMYYVAQGEARLTFEEDSFILEEGAFCIMPPHAIHCLTIDENSFVLDVIIRSSNFDSRFGELLTMSGVFSGFFRESLYGSSQPNFLLLHTQPQDRSIDLCFRGLAIECVFPDKHTWNTTNCWLKLLLSNALRSCAEKVEIYRFPTGGNPRADCGEILQFIQQNYRTVRLSTLARQFHYNETYLSRMLQNYAHQSFTEIVRDIRMNRAVEYLTNSSLRVHEIAGLVGYSSVDHFSRAFKTMYGVSPQGYRRQNRK